MQPISFTNALAIIEQHSKNNKLNSHNINLELAQGLILSQNIYASFDLPRFHNSAMDGYLVAINSDFNQPFTIIEKVFAGDSANLQQKPEPNQALRIFTGAKINISDHDLNNFAVIMQEQTQKFANENNLEQISIKKTPNSLQNIRKRGEDIAKGSCVLAIGTKLNAINMAMLASLGVSKVDVFNKLKVAILSTGKELKNLGEPLEEGQIYDSNSLCLQLMLQKLPVEIVEKTILNDDFVGIENKLLQLSQQVDLIISTGGVSVGEADFTRDVLHKIGKVLFHKVLIKPGKPIAFAKINQSYYFALPGNPISTLVTFTKFVQPFIMGQYSSTATDFSDFSQKLVAVTTTKLSKSQGRCDFQRGLLSQDIKGNLSVKSLGLQGSHVFSSTAQSNCFIHLEEQQGDVEIGEKVIVELFPDFLS